MHVITFVGGIIDFYVILERSINNRYEFDLLD